MVAQTPLGRALFDQGRSQAGLARVLSTHLDRKVHRQEVSQWALGNVTPQPRTREVIAEVLGLSPEALWSSHGAAGNHPDTPSDVGDGSNPRSAAA